MNKFALSYWDYPQYANMRRSQICRVRAVYDYTVRRFADIGEVDFCRQSVDAAPFAMAFIT
jgi:hypothetical protein